MIWIAVTCHRFESADVSVQSIIASAQISVNVSRL